MTSNEKTPMLKWLEQHNITMQDLIDAALEMYVPHPGIETPQKAAEVLEEELIIALSDPNVATLITAAFHAQEDAEKGVIPGLSMEYFMGRPGLVADELIGIAIATYIAGAKGMFEFVRFDQAKPGILKKLGPLTNDPIGALIAGASSNMYTRSVKDKSIV
ncbi:MAG: alpha-ribazole phosphatase CobZ [Candidatus Bathyarchaeota archaeon]|nr:alpha-ribazole phosphatase CobZ [Candidatus Termiticorpusculum sp.]